MNDIPEPRLLRRSVIGEFARWFLGAWCTDTGLVEESE